ncbi:MAG: helix-turn-helix domain-containing protein [Xenococcaceae cyanobacterium MO_207.B15]|nr:helix-turn-helix domain-containing protein [Xenococcaceae cyanobacterium MO_207.B15]
MKYVTPRKASEYLGVSISTLRRWHEEGKIKSIRTPGEQRRFCIEEYEGANQKPVVSRPS